MKGECDAAGASLKNAVPPAHELPDAQAWRHPNSIAKLQYTQHGMPHADSKRLDFIYNTGEAESGAGRAGVCAHRADADICGGDCRHADAPAAGMCGPLRQVYAASMIPDVRVLNTVRDGGASRKRLSFAAAQLPRVPSPLPLSPARPLPCPATQDASLRDLSTPSLSRAYTSGSTQLTAEAPSAFVELTTDELAKLDQRKRKISVGMIGPRMLKYLTARTQHGTSTTRATSPAARSSSAAQASRHSPACGRHFARHLILPSGLVSNNFKRFDLRRSKSGHRIGAKARGMCNTAPAFHAVQPKYSKAYKKKNHRNAIARSNLCYHCSQAVRRPLLFALRISSACRATGPTHVQSWASPRWQALTEAY